MKAGHIISYYKHNEHNCPPTSSRVLKVLTPSELEDIGIPVPLVLTSNYPLSLKSISNSIRVEEPFDERFKKMVPLHKCRLIPSIYAGVHETESRRLAKSFRKTIQSINEETNGRFASMLRGLDSSTPQTPPRATRSAKKKRKRCTDNDNDSGDFDNDSLHGSSSSGSDFEDSPFGRPKRKRQRRSGSAESSDDVMITDEKVVLCSSPSTMESLTPSTPSMMHTLSLQSTAEKRPQFLTNAPVFESFQSAQTESFKEGDEEDLLDDNFSSLYSSRKTGGKSNSTALSKSAKHSKKKNFKTKKKSRIIIEDSGSESSKDIWDFGARIGNDEKTTKLKFNSKFKGKSGTVRQTSRNVASNSSQLSKMRSKRRLRKRRNK